MKEDCPASTHLRCGHDWKWQQ